ncbi:MAG: hypothetical protein KKA65_04720 [Nanoarchaeota archaeon]|nr:hypothetical protein [Nanoarchaeota archaeon]MBU4242476.1 hypothetical protein [Nanoarchaeota archaeon]MBU4351984.1 hypothetical protein [Nanoarchaeota archaeon]MBU4456779.1 hypothetical protein [Nanoarchaeota archaeon]MCG2720246.1 hypothetical protein [Nanoarchaeota archaeon]
MEEKNKTKSLVAQKLEEAQLLEEELQKILKEQQQRNNKGNIIVLEERLCKVSDSWRNPYFKKGYLELYEVRREKEREFLLETSPDLFQKIMEEKKKHLPDLIKQNEKRLARGLREIDPYEVSLTKEQRKAFNAAYKDLGKDLELKCSFCLSVVEEGNNTTYIFDGGIWPFFMYDSYCFCKSYSEESHDIPEFVENTIKALSQLKKYKGLYGAKVTPVFFTSLRRYVHIFPGVDEKEEEKRREKRLYNFIEDVQSAPIEAGRNILFDFLTGKLFKSIEPFTYISRGLNEQERLEFIRLYQGGK